MLYPLQITSKFTSCAYTPSLNHFGMAPLRRPRPFPAPLPMGVTLPPLPRELRMLAWLGALLAKETMLILMTETIARPL